MTKQQMTVQSITSNRFATGFTSRNGEVFVYFAFVFALFCLLLSVLQAQTSYLFGSILGALSCFYFYPYLDTKHAQLGADHRGIYVASIGMIGWDSIVDLDVKRTAVRSVEKAELQIQLNRPLEDAVIVPDEVKLVRNFMARIWKLKRDGLLQVRLEQLNADPETIKKGLMRFWHSR